ncbi:hypothetical protein [Stenotrophomonas rhizophila]|uniref:hypothetical protein n=1 Tax=Stenotrophomonas rhizophila TaxID=216778 RepID=UPI0011A279ED|nr:hypothetical protein [Stenotrophomonas rhizophila]
MLNKYEVLLGLLPRPSSSNVLFDDGRLVIQGRDGGGRVILEIAFSSVDFIGISDEGARLRLFADMGERRGALIRCNEGSLISYYVDESLGTRSSHQLAHFIFMIGEEVIDVISGDDPEVLVGESLS